jgi:hypothetical protein
MQDAGLAARDLFPPFAGEHVVMFQDDQTVFRSASCVSCVIGFPTEKRVSLMTIDDRRMTISLARPRAAEVRDPGGLRSEGRSGDPEIRDQTRRDETVSI